ncbi:MAG: KR domain-containing protein [Comamonadaceae bacterium]|nr:KR domain-containing protein [Comamonadaceae bacterium]
MKPYADRDECAILVGATGAFGTAITKRLLDAGLGVIAAARSTDSLQALTAQYPGVRARVADIGNDSAIAAIAAALDKPVRMVMHGPGVAVAGGILTAPTESMVDAVNIKVGGLLRLGPGSRCPPRGRFAHRRHRRPLWAGADRLRRGGRGRQCGDPQRRPPAQHGLRPARHHRPHDRPRPGRHRAPAPRRRDPGRAARLHYRRRPRRNARRILARHPQHPGTNRLGGHPVARPGSRCDDRFQPDARRRPPPRCPDSRRRKCPLPTSTS